MWQEFRRRKDEGLSTAQVDIAKWAQRAFSLHRLPSQSAVSRLLKEGPTPLSKIAGIQKRQQKGKHPKLEEALSRWVLDQQYSRVMISGELIKAAGARILKAMNCRLPLSDRIEFHFSNGWLQRFQNRWDFRGIKTHGESGDADNSAIISELPKLQKLLKNYALADIWNADEFGHQYRMAPDRTIAHEVLEGRKKDKTRLTYLACGNADGSETFPLMIIGKALKPRPFKGMTGQQHGFDYWNNKKAWMTSVLFFMWLQRFDDYIGKRTGRKAILLLDNCSAHGNLQSLPALCNVVVTFLPPNTTSKIQPMDAGIIAAVKVRYRKMHMERALDAIDESIKDIYKIDQLSAMKLVQTVWNELPAKVHSKCWIHTGLLDDKMPPDTDKAAFEDEELKELTSLVSQLTVQKNRITLNQLLNPDCERVAFEIITEDKLGEGIAEEIIAEAEGEEANDEDEEEEESLPSLAEQLRALALVKRVLRGESAGNRNALLVLTRTQRRLRSGRPRDSKQTTITHFFHNQ